MGYALVVLVSVLCAFIPVFTRALGKYAQEYAYQIIVWGLIISSAALFMLLPLTGQRVEIPPLFHIFATLLYVGASLTFFLALVNTTVVKTEALQKLYPLWTGVCSYFFLKRIFSKFDFIALVVAGCGMYVVLARKKSEKVDKHPMRGALLALLSGLLVAAWYTATNLAHMSHSSNVVAWACLAGALLMPHKLRPPKMPAHIWLYVAGLGVVSTAAPLLLQVIALRTVPPLENSIITLLISPLAVTAVWLIYKERPSQRAVIGGILKI